MEVGIFWYFLVMEEGDKLKKSDVYCHFRKYVNKNIKDDDKELTKLTAFLEKLKRFSGYYKNLAHSGGGLYQNYYQTLRDLKQTTCFSYLLSLIDHL